MLGIEPLKSNIIKGLPKVSVVTVVYNGEKYLEETIKSIISQSYQNIEYIVIDGGSNDGTIDILNQYKDDIDFCVSEKDDGQTDALIKGFNICNGEILCWLNYDDLFYDDKVLSRVVDEFNNNIDVDLVFGDDILIDSEGGFLKYRSFAYQSFNMLLYYSSISQPSSFFTKKAYLKFGLRRTLNYSMDLDLWLNIFSKCKTKYYSGVLSKNRIHSDRKMIAFIDEARKEARFLRSGFGYNESLSPVYMLICKIRSILGLYKTLTYKK